MVMIIVMELYGQGYGVYLTLDKTSVNVLVQH